MRDDDLPYVHGWSGKPLGFKLVVAALCGAVAVWVVGSQ